MSTESVGGSTLTSGRDAGASSGQLLLGIHIIMMAAVLTPLWLVDIPALVDYPNHLARLHVITEWDGSTDLQRIYTVKFLPLPNIAMDLIVPPLAKYIGVILAAKLFVVSTILLFVGSTIILQRAIHGRISFSSIAVYLITFNTTLSYGFLNYLFGVGAAVLLFAAWIALKHRHWCLRLAIGATGTLLVFFCHVIAFGCYVLFVLGYELSQEFGHRRFGWRRLAHKMSFAGLQFIPSAAILWAVKSEVGRSQLDVQYLAATKILSLVTLGVFTWNPLDLLFAAALVGTFVFFSLRRELRVDRSMVLCIIGLGVAVIATPSWLSENWGNDFRLMVPLGMLIVAASHLVLRTLTSVVVIGFLLVLFGIRLPFIAAYWIHYDEVYQEIRSAATVLEPRSRVLSAFVDTNDKKLPMPLNHAPTLLLLNRDLFVPTLFSSKGRQPLSVQKPFVDISIPHGGPMRLSVLKMAIDPASGAKIIENSSRSNYFHHRFAGWPRIFDYVIVFDFDSKENPIPGILSKVTAGSIFSIYRIDTL